MSRAPRRLLEGCKFLSRRARNRANSCCAASPAHRAPVGLAGAHLMRCVSEKLTLPRAIDAGAERIARRRDRLGLIRLRLLGVLADRRLLGGFGGARLLPGAGGVRRRSVQPRVRRDTTRATAGIARRAGFRPGAAARGRTRVVAAVAPASTGQDNGHQAGRCL